MRVEGVDVPFGAPNDALLLRLVRFILVDEGLRQERGEIERRRILLNLQIDIFKGQLKQALFELLLIQPVRDHCVHGVAASKDDHAIFLLLPCGHRLRPQVIPLFRVLDGPGGLEGPIGHLVPHEAQWANAIDRVRLPVGILDEPLLLDQAVLSNEGRDP